MYTSFVLIYEIVLAPQSPGPSDDFFSFEEDRHLDEAVVDHLVHLKVSVFVISHPYKNVFRKCCFIHFLVHVLIYMLFDLQLIFKLFYANFTFILKNEFILAFESTGPSDDFFPLVWAVVWMNC